MMIYCCDFQSLYPNIMMGGNLYSPTILKPPQSWQGGGIFASKYQNDEDGVVGCYLRQQGKVEKTLYNLLTTRIQLKAYIKTLSKDDPEYTTVKNKILAVKILINTMYGIMGSPIFKSIYSLTGAGDCTAMARRAIKHARTVLEESGYECLYTDTDSVYVLDVNNNLERLQKVTTHITEVQKESMNIPVDTHLFEIECAIKRMYFFKDDGGNYIKKHYIYVKDNDEVVEKGLKIVKGDCSKLSVKIYEDKIKPSIKDGTFNFVEPEQLLKWSKETVKEDPTLLLKRYRTHPLDTYKTPEKGGEATCIGYQISKKYGAGEHWMIINKRIGAGKGNRYAPMEVLQEKYGDAWVDQVCYENYMKELSEFILPKLRGKIHTVDRRRT